MQHNTGHLWGEHPYEQAIQKRLIEINEPPPPDYNPSKNGNRGYKLRDRLIDWCFEHILICLISAFTLNTVAAGLCGWCLHILLNK